MASRESLDRSNNIAPSADTDSDEKSFEGTVQEKLDQRSKEYVPTRRPSSKKKKITVLVTVYRVGSPRAKWVTFRLLSFSPN